MASGTFCRVDGLRPLARDLKKMTGDVSDLKEANAAAARIGAVAASARAPRRTGRLAGSVRGNRAAGRATVVTGGARILYTGPIHFGWPARGIAAQPFVFEAARATEPVWLAAYERALRAVVARFSGKTY